VKNTIVYLIGFPGVGKLTVGQEICVQTGARMMDNHLINNVAFSLVRVDGSTPIPDQVWDEIKQIRDAGLRIIARHAPAEASFVLTNVLLDDAGDRALHAQVEATAEQRGALFVPVLLRCEENENMRRLVSPGREERMKETDPETARQRLNTEPLLDVAHPNRLDLDTTDVPPAATARQIIEHAERLA